MNSKRKKLFCFLLMGGMLMGMASCDQVKEWKEKLTGKTEAVEKGRPAPREQQVEKKQKPKKKVVKKVVKKKVVKKVVKK